MAVTQNNYTGNGSTVLFNFTFPYLEQTDVQVRLDGVLQPTTSYSFANATTIQFNTAPGSGVNIIIFRNTDNDNKKATFYPGSAIKAEDLNNNIDQILYVAQEVDNNAMSSLGDTPMQGDLPLGQGLGIIFEGSTTDDNETRLGVVDPTADRNINLPNVSGTVVTTGDTGTVTSTMIADGTIVSGDIADGTIVNADVNASAAIAGTKINPAFGTQNISLTGNITVSGTVDGRDVSTDGSKLDGIESGATADQTAAEIRTLVESATDSNVFTDADHTKLNNIETAATADQTASEIKSLYESNGDTNPLTDAEKTFLSDVTATATEINYTTNVTSDIQSQIDGKQPLDSELTTLAGMQSQTASQLASSTALSATTTNLNITQGMTKATSLTTNSDTEFPTSKAVNDRILTVTNALGGFVAIADKDSFPTSHPDPSGNAGTVVSISNATGISVNSSGVGTLATRAGGSDAVIINGFPSALRGGATVGSATNANPYVLPANVGLQVQTTGTAHTYDYHKYLINEEDANKLSGEIQDFQERYRVAASAPTSSLNDGDLYFDTTANKMKVYNASSSSWDDVATPGDFLINTLSSSSGSGGGSATFNGTATRFTLSNPPDQYAQQLLVSINGVIQKPNSGTSPSEGFAIDGNDIIFASAPASGASYFIVTQGSSVNIGTPSDNTVSTSKIQNGAITNDKVNASAAISGTKIAPNFGTQAIVTSGTMNTGSFISEGYIKVRDNQYIYVGEGNDFSIRHDGTYNRLKGANFIFNNAAGNESIIEAYENGAVNLYYDNSKKLETTANGVDIGTHVFTTGGNYTVGNAVLFPDSAEARFGTGNDLKIYHDGSHSYITNATNDLRILANDVIFNNAANSENKAKFINNGAVELYYDNSKKVETTSNGLRLTSPRLVIDGSVSANVAQLSMTRTDRSWNINNETELRFYTQGADTETPNTKIVQFGTTGIQLPDNIKYQAGTGNDLQIYHNGTFSFIDNNTGNLAINTASGEVQINKDTSEYMARFICDAGVELYHNNIKALETTSTGIKIIDDDSNVNAEFHDSSGLTGYVYGAGTNFGILDKSGNWKVKLYENAQTELYHHTTKCLSTQSGSYAGLKAHGSANNCSIRLQTEDTTRGTVYANSANSVGFLDSGGDWAVKHNNDTNTEFYVGTSKKATIDGDGLKFGTDTAAANGLDDYEEGTYTPADQSGAGLSLTNNTTARYTKIGRMVYVQFDITWPTTSSASAAGFTLPMNLTVSYGTGNIGWTDNGSPLFIHVGGYAYVMDNNSSNNSSQHYLNSQLSGKRIIGNLWYIS